MCTEKLVGSSSKWRLPSFPTTVGKNALLSMSYAVSNSAVSPIYFRGCEVNGRGLLSMSTSSEVDCVHRTRWCYCTRPSLHHPIHCYLLCTNARCCLGNVSCSYCTGSGWDKFVFFIASLWHYVLDLWPKQHWLHRDVLAVAEQCKLSRTFYVLSCLASEEAGGTHTAERGHSQDSRPQLTKGTLHTTGHQAHPPVKAGGKEGISGNIHSYTGCLLLNPMETCFPGKGCNLLLGSCEWAPYFALLVRTAFAIPMNLYLAEPTSVLTSALLILFLIPLGGGEWVFKAQLPAEVNPQELSKKLKEFASSIAPHKVNIILHILSSILVFYISYCDWSPI